MVKNRTELQGVILVSFEYPPRSLSIISDKVGKLAEFLSKRNISTWVITFDDWRSGIEEQGEIIVNRIPYHVPNNISFLSLVMNLKTAYQSALGGIIHDYEINLIHFFDWPCLPTLIGWEPGLKLPKLFSLHSIQSERDPKINPYNEGIKKIESLGMGAADGIISDSAELSEKIVNEYNIRKDKITVLPFKDKNFSKKIIDYYSKFID
ncbi:MAG: glycosyltransferase [Candidatus Heimdallarchaeota archaeon]|nr:glycosyltransferase [Candidatus Heimdallarchaeota archaeon]